MTYDGTTLRLYVNGEQTGMCHVGKERVPGTTPLCIGRRQDGYCTFEGMIDEVRLYDRALSAEEVRSRFGSEGADPPEAVARDCVGHWGFDEAIGADPPKRWTWTDRPTRSGRRARVTTSDTFVGHGVRLAKPVVEHLPFAPDRAVEVLRAQLPRLGSEDDVWAFFGDLLALRAEREKRVAEIAWFLDTFPDHPRAWRALNALHATWQDMGVEDVPARVAKFLRSHEVSAYARYWYHRRHVVRRSAFVRQWQALGPLRSARGQPYGIRHRLDGRSPRLDQRVPGSGGTPIGWKRVDVAWEMLDLDAELGASTDAMAYLACWVWSPKSQDVVLAAGGDDGMTVWLNGHEVLRDNNRDYRWPGEVVVDASLRQGWNELLVKVGEQEGTWTFGLEVLDHLTRAPAPGIRFATEPPEE
jgi:hypothetical protein